MVKNNKTCILCGKKYSYCSRCYEFDHLPRWMECYCSENCKNIFNTLCSYNMDHITKEEAKLRLEKCDLSHKHNFFHTTQESIDSIMTVEPTKPVSTADQVSTVEESIMNAPAPLPETTVTIKESGIAETISDPVMNAAIKQSKRMKYVGKKNN